MGGNIWAMTLQEQLQYELQQTGLDSMVSTKTVDEWFELGRKQNRPLLAMNLLLGLVSSKTPSPERAERLFKAVQELQQEWAITHEVTIPISIQSRDTGPRESGNRNKRRTCRRE